MKIMVFLCVTFKFRLRSECFLPFLGLKMKLFNYIFVSDVLSRLILFLACFLLFARDGKQNTNYDSTENTKTNGTTIGPKQGDGSMNCFCPNLFQANVFQSIIFIMVWVLEGRCHVVVMAQTWDKM